MHEPPPYADLIPYPLEAERLISTRGDGSEMRGFRLPFAKQIYADGFTPMWGLARKPAPSERVSSVAYRQVLTIARQGAQWHVLDAAGVLGVTRWRAGDQGKEHAQLPGVFIEQPDTAWLVVTQLLFRDGVVVDFGGVACVRT